VPVTAEVTEPMADVAEPVAEATGPEPELAVAEVTGLVTEVAGDATGAAAAVLVPDPVLAAAEVPEPEPDPVLVPVTAEVTEASTDVTGPVAEATGPEPELAAADEVSRSAAVAGGAVAACACREKTSKMTKIPAAVIATCTARRAMCRKIGCGMSSSRTTGGQTRPARRAWYRRPGTRRHTLLQAGFALGHPEPDICGPPANVLFGHHRTAPARVRQGTADTGDRANRGLRFPDSDKSCITTIIKDHPGRGPAMGASQPPGPALAGAAADGPDRLAEIITGQDG
jgi:hypothetical protein